MRRKSDLIAPKKAEDEETLPHAQETTFPAGQTRVLEKASMCPPKLRAEIIRGELTPRFDFFSPRLRQHREGDLLSLGQLGRKGAQELVLLLLGLEASVAVLRRGVDELELHLLKIERKKVRAGHADVDI